MIKQTAIKELICVWEDHHGVNRKVRQKAVRLLLSLGVPQEDIDAAVKAMDDRFKELLNTKG